MALNLFPVPAEAATSVPTAPTPVTIAWDYPTNEVTWLRSFRVYSSTNIALPLTNWPVFTNLAITNFVVTNFAASNLIGSNLAMKFTLPVQPGARFFSLTASNDWGESDFSNVAALPPLPRSDVNLRIRVGN